MKKKPWYHITAKADTAEILIYEQIGHDPWFDEGISAKQFVKDLNKLDVKKITLRINSPGGLVFDGHAIYNALKDHPASITVKIDGLAASIASVIAMAGDTILMPENAMIMIHKASALAIGNSDDLFSMANALAKMDDSIINVYHAKTNMDHQELADMMAAETWMTAQEAVENGFADKIIERVNITACVNADIMNRFKYVPQQFQQTGSEPANLSRKEKEVMKIDMKFLNENHADLVAEIRSQGAKEGADQGRIDGATAERERIQAVEAATLPGHEALIQALKFDGKTTGPEAALKVLQAEKQLRANVAQDLENDSIRPVNHVATPEIPEPKKPENTPKDAKARWEADEKLREEFGDFETWQAYEKAAANGQVKILGQKKGR